jgi:hypothetical protein
MSEENTEIKKKRQKITLENFIERSNIKHKFKYDYSIFKLIDYKIKGAIICSSHGVFWQTPHNHLNGDGCKDCAIDKRRITFEEFKTRSNIIHNNKYYYIELFIDEKRKKYVKLICPIHDVFQQRIDLHLAGHGCKDCANDYNKLTLEEFKLKADLIHNNKYNYVMLYVYNNRTYILAICPKHFVFSQRIDAHLSGNKCPDCSPIQKNNERLVKKFLIDNNIEFNDRFKLKLPRNKPGRYTYPDFYLPFYNLLIEYNGEHHYGPARYIGKNIEEAKISYELQKIRDQQLREYCKENNMNLLEIDGRIYKNKKIFDFLNNYFNIEKQNEY